MYLLLTFLLYTPHCHMILSKQNCCLLRYPMYKWAFFMPCKVLNTIYFLKGNNADNSNVILLGLEKQRGITLEA